MKQNCTWNYFSPAILKWLRKHNEVKKHPFFLLKWNFIANIKFNRTETCIHHSIFSLNDILMTNSMYFENSIGNDWVCILINVVCLVDIEFDLVFPRWSGSGMPKSEVLFVAWVTNSWVSPNVFVKQSLQTRTRPIGN